MNRKRLYITVEEREELRVLTEQYKLKEMFARFREAQKPDQQTTTRKQRRRSTNL